jgi:hypothetical protein
LTVKRVLQVRVLKKRRKAQDMTLWKPTGRLQPAQHQWRRSCRLSRRTVTAAAQHCLAANLGKCCHETEFLNKILAAPRLKEKLRPFCGTQVSLASLKHAQLVRTSSKYSPPLLLASSTQKSATAPYHQHTIAR